MFLMKGKWYLCGSSGVRCQGCGPWVHRREADHRAGAPRLALRVRRGWVAAAYCSVPRVVRGVVVAAQCRQAAYQRLVAQRVSGARQCGNASQQQRMGACELARVVATVPYLP